MSGTLYRSRDGGEEPASDSHVAYQNLHGNPGIWYTKVSNTSMTQTTMLVIIGFFRLGRSFSWLQIVHTVSPMNTIEKTSTVCLNVKQDKTARISTTTIQARAKTRKVLSAILTCRDRWERPETFYETARDALGVIAVERNRVFCKHTQMSQRTKKSHKTRTPSICGTLYEDPTKPSDSAILLA